MHHADGESGDEIVEKMLLPFVPGTNSIELMKKADFVRIPCKMGIYL
jgi:hypothetical protein